MSLADACLVQGHHGACAPFHACAARDIQVEGFDGNFADYEEDKKRRLGEASVKPHRTKFTCFERR